jgi:hypothetical protein
MILDAIATLFGTITYSSLEWPVLGRGLACSVDFLLLLFSWDLFFGSTAHCVKGCHGQKAWCEEATASVVWVLAVELSGMVVADVVLGAMGQPQGSWTR